MGLKRILKDLNFSVDHKEFRKLKTEVNKFVRILDEAIKKEYEADVFLGGSFAKRTLTKSERYDADIFVRFDWKYENLSDKLEKVVIVVAKRLNLKVKKIHGSRDYFRVFGEGNLVFEIIPVVKIKKVNEARNVTDLSYFHVRYVRRKLNEKMRRELALAKRFLKAHSLYGAESYIQGFSGYGLECLIIYYKSFEKMLKELVKVPRGGRIVIDIEKHYKKKNEVFFEINESKLASPIILVDPTWKERNVLASLSTESFEKFQDVARKFLRNPSQKYFYKEIVDSQKIKKETYEGELLNIKLKTDRQEGDIAGTKMKKFSRLIERILGQYFLIVRNEFVYSGEGNFAHHYLIVKNRKKEIVKIGPPLGRIADVKRFEDSHKKTMYKEGYVCAKLDIGKSAKEFLKKWANSKEGILKMKDMGIIEMNFEE